MVTVHGVNVVLNNTRHLLDFHIASTEKIAKEKFFFQVGREKIGFFREIKMVYGSIARPERSKLGS